MLVIRILHIFTLVFFILLILFALFDVLIRENQKIIEGLDTNDPLYVSKTSAGEIDSLKKQMKELEGIKDKLSKIENKNTKNEEEMVKIRKKGEEMKEKAKKSFDDQLKVKKKEDKNEEENV